VLAHHCLSIRKRMKKQRLAPLLAVMLKSG
jgi:hypothetical protein